MWRRDWSRLALLRTSRWQNRGTAPRPASIGRTITQPPLRLFGAGRRPGPSTATALPRSLPFVLRLKPPSRPVGPPMLTMQSEVPVEADPRIQPAPAIEASETSPPIHPETQLAPAAGQASLEAPTVRREAQAPASLVSRVLRIFRRPSPQSVSEEPTVAPQADSPPHPEEAPPTEPMPVSLQTPGQAAVARSPQAKTQPEAQPLVVRRSVEPTAEVSPEPAPARQADQAEAPQLPPRQAVGPGEPPVAAQAPFSAPEAREAPQVREAPRPAERAGAEGGVLFTLRRAFRREPAESSAEQTPAPAQALATSTLEVARQPELVDSAPVVSAQPEAISATEPEEEPRRQGSAIKSPASIELREVVSPFAAVAVSAKVSFCVIDTDLYDAVSANGNNAYYTQCGRNVDLGLSVGWADVYGYWLDGQSIDVTSTPNGQYCLVSTADPDNGIEEIDDTNNIASVLVTIDGNQVTVGAPSCH